MVPPRRLHRRSKKMPYFSGAPTRLQDCAFVRAILMGAFPFLAFPACRVDCASVTDEKNFLNGSMDGGRIVAFFEKGAVIRAPGRPFALPECFRNASGLLPGGIASWSNYRLKPGLQHVAHTASAEAAGPQSLRLVAAAAASGGLNISSCQRSVD
jgi:hypothetical protein